MTLLACEQQYGISLKTPATPATSPIIPDGSSARSAVASYYWQDGAWSGSCINSSQKRLTQTPTCRETGKTGRPLQLNQ